MFLIVTMLLYTCGVCRGTVVAGKFVSTCLRLSSEVDISILKDELRHKSMA
jgi:hypothetical protein